MTVRIDLSGKAALVTGGSRGLGAEMCRQLAAAGAAVAVHYATAKDKAEKAALEVGWEAFQASWELNVRSAYVLTRALVAGMRRVRYGRVVNVLSMAAHA